MVNLTPLSEDYPTWIREDQYLSLSTKNNNGWSNCETIEEWLVKLDYLRTGLKEEKITQKDFFTKEKDLVMRWWNRWV